MSQNFNLVLIQGNQLSDSSVVARSLITSHEPIFCVTDDLFKAATPLIIQNF